MILQAVAPDRLGTRKVILTSRVRYTLWEDDFAPRYF